MATFAFVLSSVFQDGTLGAQGAPRHGVAETTRENLKENL